MSENNYKFLNRTEVCSNSRFNVYFDHLITPNNTELKNFLIVKPKIITKEKLVGICVLPLVKNKYCLMQGWRHQLNEIVYQAPSGFIENEEQPEETAIRELREETALICSSKDLISLGSYLPDAGLIEGKVALFLASNCKKSEENLDKEIGTGNLLYFKENELISLIKNESNIGGSTVVAAFRAINKIY